eukprot:TRINITY_DN5761_c0_g1_i1.p1 TRINITY_DN5761_c0_g1~~TRINITY_DN5761_c0_g1_i1.p1  ORF type:complete len:106 (+),score=10.23 TRINITY_DN5761_c0_g1_i1:62-379(+)
MPSKKKKAKKVKTVTVSIESTQGLPRAEKLEFPETQTMLSVMKAYINSLNKCDQGSPIHYSLVPGVKEMGKEMFTPPLNQELRNLLVYCENREITINVSKTPSMG